jgi:hypothetical protein
MSDVVFDRMMFDHLDQSKRIADLVDEVARLRLADEEREAVERAARAPIRAGFRNRCPIPSPSGRV